MDGSGNLIRGYMMGALFSNKVSPVNTSFSLATAPMSPACRSVTG